MVTEAQFFHQTKENKMKLSNYVLQWTEDIDNLEYINLSITDPEEKETAYSI